MQKLFGFVSARGYPVQAEFQDTVLRERQTGEVVHHKKREGQTRCLKCWSPGPFVWLASDSSHERHPARCFG